MQGYEYTSLMHNCHSHGVQSAALLGAAFELSSMPNPCNAMKGQSPLLNCCCPLLQAHLNEDDSFAPQGAQFPAPTGYNYTVDFSALPDPQTLPNSALDLFPKPQLCWPWAQPDSRPGVKSTDVPAQTATASSAGGVAGGISPQCEQRLHASITKGLLEVRRVLGWAAL